MSDIHRVNRRCSLAIFGLASAALVASCGGQPVPSAASSAPTPAPAAAATSLPVAATSAPSVPTAGASTVAKATPAATTAGAATSVEVVLVQRNIPQDVKFFQDLGNRFAAQNPSISVKIETMAQDFAQTLQARLAAGTAGDMARNSTHNTLVGQALLGLFKPVDEFVKGDGYDLKGHFESAIKAATVKGELICLPWNCHPGWSAIYYLQGLFDQAKIGYPTGDWTYSDWRTAAEKLTTSQNGRPFQYGMWLGPSFEAVLTIVTAEGGTFQSEDGTKPTYTDPKTIAGLQYQADAYQKWKTSPANPAFDSRVALWTSNRVATVLSGIWENAYLGDVTPKGETMGVAPGPKGSSGQLGGYFGCNVYPIWSSSKHPQEAWLLQKYLATKEVGILDYQAGIEPGARPDVWEDPAVANDPRVKPHAAAIKIVKPMPVPANGRLGELRVEIQKVMDVIWIGEKSVTQGVADMQTAAEKIMAMPPPGA